MVPKNPRSNRGVAVASWKTNGTTCFDWSFGLLLEGGPSKNRGQLGQKIIAKYFRYVKWRNLEPCKRYFGSRVFLT